MFEAAEGGAGVLRRLATEQAQVRAVARKALEILHFDPDTGADRGKAEHATELCSQACYDCLLSYGNQWDHQSLDRHCVVGLLRQLARATLEVGAGGEERTEVLRRLEKVSNGLEKEFLQFLDAHGYRLPDSAQQLVEGYYVRPDFAFHGNNGDIAIFIDGPIHDSPHQAEKDEHARAKLEDEAGWLVLRFGYTDKDGWGKIVAEHPGVFGPGHGAQ
jgi:very-short-patch-repair endonuclease